MWLFKIRPGRVADSAATDTIGDTCADEHSMWGVGGPAILPGALLAEMAEALAAAQDAPATPQP